MFARYSCTTLALAIYITLFAGVPLQAAPPANDNCSSPTAISGNGTFNFDLTQATTGPEGQDWCGGITNDVWFCWTPTCSGMATIQTCGLTSVNTKIFYYIGCACPTPPPSPSPFCCDDDGCGNAQSKVVCETYCGQPMMIRIGVKPGFSTGIGQFSITCNGTACQTCDDCCGKRPNFLTQTGGTGFNGGVAVMTQEAGINQRVVDYVDISSQPATGSLVNWFAPFFAPSGPQDWSKPNLGSIFGVTLDNLGNTFLAHASCYGSTSFGPGDAIGTIPGGAPGAIYKIDTNTGIPSTFAVLPNALITGCTTPPDCYPGLGQICFSCQHNMLYVSNHEDGRIYRLNTAGTVLSTWRHATGTVLGGMPPLDPNGFSPLTPQPNTGRAQRVWAVRVSKGRLYYSTWREDVGRPDPLRSNEIWSVNLLPSGEFIAGSEQLELLMPAYNASTFSNPVSDISFRPNTCCMLLAERTMQDDTTSYAHSSRLLEYCKTNNVWTPSGTTFNVGNPSIPDSCAGGCDYDFATGAGVNVNVWSTGDAIKLTNPPPPDPYIYGLGGMTFSGTNPYSNGIMIDSNQITGAVDKFQQGDVEITCPQANTPVCAYDPLTRQCTSCPTPGVICGPTKVVQDSTGHYEIAACDCLPDGHCRIQYNGPDVPPTCVDPCPVPPGGTCNPQTQSNPDGTIAFTCGCVNNPPDCQVVNIPDPLNPGTTTSACAGPCTTGLPCTPVEIREFPAGSGNFTITQCSCDPQSCHPVVEQGHVVCEGSCPTPNGGICNVVAIPEPPINGVPGGILYHCVCECKKPPQNMVNWWPMNGLAPVKDRVNWLNHGTPSGGVTVATAANSCVGQGLVFNGTNGFVSVPNTGASSADINFGGGDFTLEGWVKTNVQGYQPMVDKRGGAFPNVVGYAFFLWSGGNIGFQIGSPPFANFLTSGFNVQDGQCHHVAAVVKRGSPNQIRLYVDGVFQSFTNSNVVGSVNNTVPLLFGREYVFSGGSPVHFNGLLDDWEFYKRTLTNQEIIDLYKARTFGKCCDTCYAPAIVFCRNENAKKVCIQICNYCDQDANFNWSLSGPTGGAGCAATGPMIFSPSSGSTGPVPPGQCRTICVNLTLPTGIPIPPPIVTGCYQLAVTNATTGRQFTCSNTVTRTRDLCFICNPPCPIPVVLAGTTRDFSLSVTNDSSSNSANVDYRWTVRYPNSDNAPDAQAISLNGLPPGEPVLGTLSVAPGGSTQVPISVTVLENEQFQPIEIKLEADTDGDGVPDPVEAISVKTTNCAVGVVGDMNEDGATTSADVPAFVSALRGAPVKVYDVVLADTNCDGVLNGKDIQNMVNALLTGP